MCCIIYLLRSIQNKKTQSELEILAVKKRKSILLKILLLGFLVYITVSLASLQVEFIKSRKELKQVQNEKRMMSENIENLTALLEGDEKDIIEQVARDKLGYVYEDEQVYADLSGN